MGRNFKQLVILASIIFALCVHIVLKRYGKGVDFSMQIIQDSTNDENEQRSSIPEKKSLEKGKWKSEEFHDKEGQMTRDHVLRDELKTFDPFTLNTPIPFLPEYKNPCFKDEYGKLYCLPYFFLLASQKSGTTDLYQKLIAHQLITTYRKEYHWWYRARFRSYPRHPQRNFTEYMDWYGSTTTEIQDFVVEGENSKYHPLIFGDFSASSIYDQLEWRNMPQNYGLLQPIVISADVIKHVLPKAKFIVLLRNPTDRLYSDYNYFHKGNLNSSSKAFDKKVKDGISWFQDCLSRHLQNIKSCLYDIPEYVDTSDKMWHPEKSWDPVIRIRAGLYSEFLNDWFNVFPRNQFYVVILDQFSKHTVTELENIYTFLELPKLNSDLKIDTEKINLKSGDRIKVPFWNGTKQIVNEFYQPYNIKLSKLLGADKMLWEEV